MNALRLARARSGPFDSAARSAVMSEALIKVESNGDPNGIRTHFRNFAMLRNSATNMP
jgi:hypothetical protein